MTEDEADIAEAQEVLKEINEGKPLEELAAGLGIDLENLDGFKV